MGAPGRGDRVRALCSRRDRNTLNANAMWAQDSSTDLPEPGVRNLLDTRSVSPGVTAVVISMTLNLLALASTVSMLADGVKARGTVFQNTQGGRRTAVKGTLISFPFGFLG